MSEQSTIVSTPEQLRNTLRITKAATSTVHSARSDLYDILNGNDKRLVVIIGPCSIHDADAAIEYATRLQTQIHQYRSTLCIIMRTYMEKPRTIMGWKGLINDPDLNAQFDMQKGLSIARSLLIEINSLGVPTGSEILNPLTVPYLVDLLSWSVVGARTAESQVHRELASNLPMAVGIKNSTSGNIAVAMDGIQAANHPHYFLGTNSAGQLSVIQSPGNPYCHIVLRGSHAQPNFDTMTFSETLNTLKSRGLCEQIMIDCSHGNSQKEPANQMQVIEKLSQRIATNQCAPFGVMIESNLVSGKQHLSRANKLTYGQSITDACIGWEETTTALAQLHDAMIRARVQQPLVLN